jgi:hypothetical protein
VGLYLSNPVVPSIAEPEQSDPLEDIAAWLSSDVAGDPRLFVEQAFVMACR